MQLKYYKELDGVRGVAAIMVMLFHFINGLTYSGAFFQFVKKVSFLGQTGVSLFFVLSGFLITRILIQQKSQPFYFKKFYFRRALRIFPLYFLFLIIYFIIISIFNHSFSLNSFFYYVVYIQNFAMTFHWNITGPEHLWSLAVEEHFYLCWPLFVYFVDRKYLYHFIIGMIILSIFIRIYLIHQNLESFYFTFSRLDELSFGCLLALKELRNELSLKKFKFNKTTITIICFFCISILLIWYLLSGAGNNIIQIFKYTILGYIYYIFIGLIIQLDMHHCIKKLFTSFPLTFSGKISYGLYIYHPLCFLLLNYVMDNHFLFLNFLFSIIFTYLISFISFYYFENPFIKLKKKLAI